jgi:hypothetical protein
MFVETFKDPACFYYALKELEDTWRGPKYIKAIKAAQRSRKGLLDPAQGEVLSRF